MLRFTTTNASRCDADDTGSPSVMLEISGVGSDADTYRRIELAELDGLKVRYPCSKLYFAFFSAELNISIPLLSASDWSRSAHVILSFDMEVFAGYVVAGTVSIVYAVPLPLQSATAFLMIPPLVISSDPAVPAVEGSVSFHIVRC